MKMRLIRRTDGARHRRVFACFAESLKRTLADLPSDIETEPEGNASVAAHQRSEGRR